MPVDAQLVAAVRGVWDVQDLAPPALFADRRFQALAECIAKRCGGGRLAFSLSNALLNLGAPCALRVGASPSRQSAEIVAAALLRAFSITTTVRRHLCPLDLSDDLPNLSFGPARIDNFSIEELERLFDAKRLERNYPGEPVDFVRLAQVQWLVLEEEVAVDPRHEARAVPFFFKRVDADFGAVDPLARRYPAVVEDALFCLLLAPWESWGTMTMVDWRGFHLPWVYTVDEDLAVQPATPPNTALLTFETVNRLGSGARGRRARGDHLWRERRVVPVVHRRGPRPSPRAATSAGGDGRGRCLWTHRVNPREGGPGGGFSCGS